MESFKKSTVASGKLLIGSCCHDEFLTFSVLEVYHNILCLYNMLYSTHWVGLEPASVLAMARSLADAMVSHSKRRQQYSILGSGKNITVQF